MITALISSVVGMFGGLLPDIFKEIRETREHDRELQRMDKNAELQIKLLEAQTDAKLAEIDASVFVEEMRAFAKQMEHIYDAQKPIGIKWIDVFNAMIRPTTASLIMLMFVGTASMYIFAILDQFAAGSVTLDVAAVTIWGSLIGEAIQAVLGFLFGYRCLKSARRRISER